MGDIIDLNDYRQVHSNLEKEYLKELPFLQRHFGIPKDMDKLVKCFYFTLRYLEGNVNAFGMVTAFHKVPKPKVEEMKIKIIEWLEEIIEALKES